MFISDMIFSSVIIVIIIGSSIFPSYIPNV